MQAPWRTVVFLAISLSKILPSMLLHSGLWIRCRRTLPRSFNLSFLAGPDVAGAARQAVQPSKAPNVPPFRAKTITEEVLSFPHAPDSFGGVANEAAPDLTPSQVCLQVRIQDGSFIQLGGRVEFFLHNWSRVTQDAWVLQTVQGFRLEFYQTLLQESIPPPLHFSRQDTSVIDSEIRELLQKRAIAFCDSHPSCFCSNIFLIQKRGGGHLLVINFRDFNAFIVYRHFKMEGLHLLPDLLQPGDWLMRLDLKDAYLTIPSGILTGVSSSSGGETLGYGVFGPSLQALLGALVFYQAAQAGSGVSEGESDSLDILIMAQSQELLRQHGSQP
ncbi:uncharacterized protein [Pleurodeles waltl]|uniref:uncharacterized protein n=1 Tax=Pleurodeles waltl TaxID=8319 RepID=UPI0037095196